jgi:branched-chain amino acid transport system permease protein
MAGALFGYYGGIIYPQFTFDPAVDVAIVMMAFLGGLGTLAGPLVGAFIAEPLQQYLSLQFGGQSLNLVLYGAILLMILLFLPRGIVPSLQRIWISWKASRSKGVQVSATRKEQPALVERRKG